MKNRKMLLPSLLSIALAFSLILPASAAGASATMPRPDYHSIGHLTVDSSSGASTMPLNTLQGKAAPMVAAGEYHTVGLKSDGTLVAVGDNNYRQCCDVDGWNLPLSVPSQEVQVGIKAGDWIKIEYKITGWPALVADPEWLKLEFLSIENTSATVQVTMHLSDGTEQSDTVPVEVSTGNGEAFGLSGFVVPANLTTGDSFYLTGYGNLAIEGETTRTYAGARRTVVYASFTQYIAYFTYYWDKLTGILMEASIIYPEMTLTAKAIETNMWEATTVRMPWWLWVIIAAATGAVAFAVYRLKRRKTPTTPTPPTEGT